MYELQDIHLEVVKSYTLGGANTFPLMKHKYKGHTYDWRHHYFYNVVLRWISKCTDLKNAWVMVGGCKGPGSHLVCRPPKDEAAFRVKRTDYNVYNPIIIGESKLILLLV